MPHNIGTYQTERARQKGYTVYSVHCILYNVPLNCVGGHFAVGKKIPKVSVFQSISINNPNMSKTLSEVTSVTFSSNQKNSQELQKKIEIIKSCQ